MALINSNTLDVIDITGGEGASRGHPKIGGLRVESTANADAPPLITVVTAVLNARSELERTINSVLFQNCPQRIEYLVIDGGSTDGTLEILNSYSSKIDYWISEPDEGISDAWNKGIKLARGDYIAFLNAGDEYLPGVLGRVSGSFGSHDFYWGDILWEKESGVVEHFKGRDGYRDVINYVMPFNHPSMFFRREPLLSIAGYDKKYRYAMDYELVRKLVAAGSKGAYLDVVITKMSAGGLHDRNYGSTLREVRRIAVQYGAQRSLAWLASWYTCQQRRGGNNWLAKIVHGAVKVRRRILGGNRA